MHNLDCKHNSYKLGHSHNVKKAGKNHAFRWPECKYYVLPTLVLVYIHLFNHKGMLTRKLCHHIRSRPKNDAVLSHTSMMLIFFHRKSADSILPLLSCTVVPVVTGFNLKTWSFPGNSVSAEAVMLRGSFLLRSGLALFFIPFHFNSPAQPSAFLMPLLMCGILRFMQWKIFKNMEHWKQNRAAGGQIFAHLNDHFRKRTFFCFYCFWRHAVIAPLYRLSGPLTSPPVSISMCEQAQKERNEVHVWIRCQKLFSGSSLGAGCESEPLTLRPSEVLEVWKSQRGPIQDAVPVS